jgi:hypothetical protein
MIWGGIALVVLVAIAVLLVRGDDIAQSLRGGSSHSTSTTETAPEIPTGSATDVPTPNQAPTQSSPAKPPATAASAAPQAPCSAQAFWQDSRPAELAAMTITNAKCVGDYALVSLSQPEGSVSTDPAQLFITMRSIPNGWGVIATTTDLDCLALQQIDPGVPAQLCG